MNIHMKYFIYMWFSHIALFVLKMKGDD